MKTMIFYLNQSLKGRLFLLFVILFTGITVTAAQDISTGVKIFENKNYYGAKKFFTDYLQKNPDNAEANYYLGRIAYINKNNDEASDYFDKSEGIKVLKEKVKRVLSEEPLNDEKGESHEYHN